MFVLFEMKLYPFKIAGLPTHDVLDASASSNNGLKIIKIVHLCTKVFF